MVRLLLAEEPTVEGVLALAERGEKIKGLTKKNIESLNENAAVARLCKRLATIETKPNVEHLGEGIVRGGTEALRRGVVDYAELDRIVGGFPELESLRSRLVSGEVFQELAEAEAGAGAGGADTAVAVGGGADVAVAAAAVPELDREDGEIDLNLDHLQLAEEGWEELYQVEVSTK